MKTFEIKLSFNFFSKGTGLNYDLFLKSYKSYVLKVQ